MRNKVLLFCLIFAICLCSTYAWIIDTVSRPTKYVYVDLRNNELPIVNDDNFEIQICEYIGSSATPVETGHRLEMNNMVPGDSLRFTIRFRNTSGFTEFCSLYISGLSCSIGNNSNCTNIDNLLDYLYISIAPSTGYANSENKPEYMFLQLSALPVSDVTNSIILYNSFPIPYTADLDSYVELECRLWFDIDAPEFNDIHFDIGSFVLSV